jgi:predicted DNA binding protein
VQTVTLEFRTKDLELLGVIPSEFFDRYEEVELLETLRLERGWRLQLLRIRRRGALRSAEELERESRRIRSIYGLQSFELVERRPRTRDYIVLVRQRNPEGLRRLLELSAGRITPTAPFRIDAERTVATFHATERWMRRVLERLRREEVPFRVVRAARHPIQDDPALPGLTAKQRNVVARAWALGHYAVPRRITLTRLARVTGQSPPALGKMLRRAEGRLVAQFLAGHSGGTASDEADEASPSPPA